MNSKVALSATLLIQLILTDICTQSSGPYHHLEKLFNLLAQLLAWTSTAKYKKCLDHTEH